MCIDAMLSIPLGSSWRGIPWPSGELVGPWEALAKSAGRLARAEHGFLVCRAHLDFTRISFGFCYVNRILLGFYVDFKASMGLPRRS